MFAIAGEVPPVEEWPLKSDATADAGDQDEIAGAAGSPGVATGRARVVIDAYADDPTEPGEVLVAPITDPGWMPLFVGAVAVVAEMGGELSHTMIVSRDLGIPAVVGAVGATSVIKTGDLVEVDGSNGVVRILERAMSDRRSTSPDAPSSSPAALAASGARSASSSPTSGATARRGRRRRRGARRGRDRPRRCDPARDRRRRRRLGRRRSRSTSSPRTGRIDVVVNNAGILRDRVVWKLTDADWQAVLGVHLTGTFNMTRAAIPTMREQGYGRFVNVTSYTGLHGNVGQANYAAAKAGIIGFTRTTAKELARFGITVNAISPNAETDMVASIPEDRARAAARRDPDGPLLGAVRGRVPPSASSPPRRPATSPASCCPSTAGCRSRRPADHRSRHQSTSSTGSRRTGPNRPSGNPTGITAWTRTCSGSSSTASSSSRNASA